MADTIFFRETIPFSERPADRVIDRAVLPSGIEVALVEAYDEETSAYRVALRLSDPEESDPQLVALPLPPAHLPGITGYPGSLEAAPGGSVAVFYDTVTYSSDGSDEFPHMVTQPLDTDGLPLGKPMVLFSWDGQVYWMDQVYLDDGSYAWLQLRETRDAEGHYIGSRFEIVRSTPDGTAFPPLPVPEALEINEFFQALPDGGLVIVWRSNDYDDGFARTLQVYYPDGSSINQPLPVETDEDFFVNFQLVPREAGPLLVWWESIDYRDERLRAVEIDPDGTVGPARTLIDLDEDGGIVVYGLLHEIQPFDDGGFGVIYTQASDRVKFLYQAFNEDGAAVGSTAVLYDQPRTDEASLTEAWLLPGGGAVLLEYRGISGGSDYNGLTYGGGSLFLRHFGPDGKPLGPAACIVEFPSDRQAYDFRFTSLQDEGTLLFWSSSSIGPERQETEARVGFAPVAFRSLTEGNDTETLTTPDAVDGLAGDDVINGSDGTDRILGGDGNDTLAGGSGNDFLFGGKGNNQLDGGNGTDAAHFDGPSDQFDFAFSADWFEITVTGPESVDRLTGFERFDFDDRSLTLSDMLLEGGFYNDSILGTEADDTLEGDQGDDTLEGLAGNDLLDGGDGRDVLNGGEGHDTMIGGPEAGDGGDRIFGGDGNDSIVGGAGNDLLYGMNGDDTILGGFGVDEMEGQDGNDVITGSAYSDLVFGGAGNDFVNGGYGHDRINGGTGADKFFHVGVFGHGSDWVQDYSATEGDILLFGNTSAQREHFRVNFAHTENAEGDRSGDDIIREAFVVYRPTGQIMWALVDGEGQDEINLKIGGDIFDLLA